MDFGCGGNWPTIIEPNVPELASLGVATIIGLVVLTNGARKWLSVQKIRDGLQVACRTARIHISRPTDPISLKFAEECSKAKKQYMDSGTKALVVMMTFCSAWLVMSFFIGAQQRLSWWWMITWTGWFLFATLASIYPGLHSVRGYPFSYWVGVLFMSFFVLPFGDCHKEDILKIHLSTTIAMILLSPAAGVGASIMGNIIYTCAVSTSFTLAHGYTGGGDMSQVQNFFTIGLSMLCLASCLIISSMKEFVRSSVESQAIGNERNALGSLLDIICDAVVEIDESGKILSSAQNLQSILLLPGSLMEGLNIQQFFFEEADTLAFESGQIEKKATARHVNLRDAMGGRIKTEVFQVPFSYASAKSKYLIGIKEFGDGVGTPRETSLAEMKEFPKGSLEEGLTESRRSGTWDGGGGARAGLGDLGHGSHQDSDSEGSSASVHSRVTERYEEGFMRTRFWAIDLSLINVMSAWNVGYKASRACCRFHAAGHELKASTKRITKMRCSQHFNPTAELAQCPCCGIMGGEYMDDSENCIVCEALNDRFPNVRESTPKRPRKGRPARDESMQDVSKAFAEVQSPTGGKAPPDAESWHRIIGHETPGCLESL